MISIRRLTIAAASFAIVSALLVMMINAIGTIGSFGYSSSRTDAPSDVLLVGLDNRSSTDKGLPDSLTLIHLENRKITSISREWTFSNLDKSRTLVSKYLGPIECEPFCNIQGLYAYSQLSSGVVKPNLRALEVLRTVVETEYEIPSLAVVAFDLAWAKSFLNNLGGLQVDVKEPVFIGGNGQNGNPKDFRGTLALGRQTLSGDQLFWYVRSRFETSNNSRMARQRSLIAMIREQKSGFDFVTAAFNARGYLVSDLSLVEFFALTAKNY